MTLGAAKNRDGYVQNLQGAMTVPSFLLGFSSGFHRVSFTETSRFCRHVFLKPKADLIKGVGMFFFRPELSRRQWWPL